MNKMYETLSAGLPCLGLELNEQTKKTLCAFGQAVVEQNQVMNLTAITEPEQVAKLHLLDSLTLLTLEDLRGKRVIDVGCGAGFPGVPLKIACPELRLTLLDSLGKRMRWLETCLPELGVVKHHFLPFPTHPCRPTRCTQQKPPWTVPRGLLLWNQTRLAACER